MAVAASAVVAISFSVSASVASLCTAGEGAGQCKQPRGLAVDTETGRTYVADRGNNRIDVFDEAGALLFSFGSAQLEAPTSVAVDNDASSASHHDVYVADFGHRRIAKFDDEGHFLLAFGEGEYAKEGAGITEGILVGTSSGSEQVYVVDVRRAAFNTLSQCVLGESGGTTEKCLTTRLRRYAPGGGAPVFQKDVATTARSGVVFGNLRGLAVDSGGDLYIRNVSPGESLCKYDNEGVKVAGFRESGCFPQKEVVEVEALALDAADNLFVWGIDLNADKHEYQVVAQYNPAGRPLHRFVYALGSRAVGLAVRPDAPVGPGTPIYASVSEEVRIVFFPESGPIAIGPSVEGVTSTKALLQADVNPEGKETTYHFEYVPASVCEEDETDLGAGHCFDHAKSSEPETLAIEGATLAEKEEHQFRLNRAGPEEVGCPDPVSEAGLPESPCLIPETEYRWRIVANNEDSDGAGEGTIEGEPFETTPSLEIEDIWVTGAGTDSASLHAAVNPLGIPTTGFFEYTTEAAYLKDKAESGDGFAGATRLPASGSLDFGAGETSTVRAATAFPLQADTAYRFRFFATDPLLEAVEEAMVSEEVGSFATFALAVSADCAEEGTRGGLAGARGGAAAFLPDCRAYELVTPLDKNNADILHPFTSDGRPAALEQSSVDGERLAYNAQAAFGEPEGGPWSSQYLAARRAGKGWASHPISSRRERLLVKPIKQAATEFQAFSPDLCTGWLRTFADPPLTPDGVEGNLNLYRRDDGECGAFSYEALTTIAPPHLKPENNLLELQGVAASGERTIYAVNDTLPGTDPVAPAEPAGCATSPVECKSRLYSQSDTEGTRYVCILPGGGKADSCGAGTYITPGAVHRLSSVQNAISADGSRIFWSTPAPGEGAIYMRDSKGTPEGLDDETTAVSQAGEALSATSQSRFICAAASGAKAVYETGSDLYEFYPDGEGGGLTHEIAGDLAGVAGCSDDASSVYFATTEALEGEEGEEENSEEAEALEGKPNLYLYEASATPGEAGSYAFIGTLTEADANQVGLLAPGPEKRLSRITPSGEALAFMSRASLTGYDNIDASTGEADMEVFIYDAGSGELSCATCNPTGSRPLGAPAARPWEDEAAPRSAAWIPGWETVLYAPNALSEDGHRLLFEASDRLVARDTDGHTDVYQWEAPGEGTCTVSSSSYVPADGGCIDLISSGLESRDAELRDASPSGEDVFFATQTSLLPQDPGLVDIYDARVGGGLPVPEVSASGCEGEACQSPPPAPERQTPASEAFRGPGNVPNGKRCPKGRRKVHSQGKTRCVKRHGKSKRHHRAGRRSHR